MKIEALHEFHNMDFAKEWADKFTPTPERIDLFETMLNSINQINENHIHILELGIGPGFLAEFLLSNLENATYQGLDYSIPMLKIAERRLTVFKDRICFTQADLTNPNWIDGMADSPRIVVSTWALHDLFNEDSIHSVYKNVEKLLAPNGIFLNGDFIKPNNVKIEYEKGRIEINKHLKMLESVGFKSVKCIKEFEIDIDNPTTSNNYACFEAKK